MNIWPKYIGKDYMYVCPQPSENCLYHEKLSSNMRKVQCQQLSCLSGIGNHSILLGFLLDCVTHNKPLYFQNSPHWLTLKILYFPQYIFRLLSYLQRFWVENWHAWLPESLGWPKSAIMSKYDQITHKKKINDKNFGLKKAKTIRLFYEIFSSYKILGLWTNQLLHIATSRDK